MSLQELVELSTISNSSTTQVRAAYPLYFSSVASRLTYFGDGPFLLTVNIFGNSSGGVGKAATIGR